jgi:ribosomal protein S18 acetylase RimI-like enzyme
MGTIRLAQASDLESICALDALAQQDHHCRDFIARSISGGNCFVAIEGSLLGYVLLDYTFFSNGFVSMLYMQPEFRRRGIGSRLLEHLEGVCRTSKLFTSTNLSNLPMQSLLAKLNYRLSGVIHDLDEGDPELVYVKYLERNQG